MLKMLKYIAYTSFSHAFALAESNGTNHFALRGRERLPQEPSKIPPHVAFPAPRRPAGRGQASGAERKVRNFERVRLNFVMNFK